MAAEKLKGLSPNFRRIGRIPGGEKAAPKQTRVEGLVEILGDFPNKRAWRKRDEVHSGAILKTAKGRITVCLGPVWYFIAHNYPIKAGDKLEVVGISVRQNHCDLLLAEEVQMKNKRLRLRDKKGIPFWARIGEQTKAERLP
jgi:hypothetical protein